jgi:septal ring factor EnvC (AmiA/AmiB activator)
MKQIILFSMLTLATPQEIAMEQTPDISFELLKEQTNEIARLQKLVETYRINCTRLAQVVSDQKSSLAKLEQELKQKDMAIAEYKKYNQNVQGSLESLGKVYNYQP